MIATTTRMSRVEPPAGRRRWRSRLAIGALAVGGSLVGVAPAVAINDLGGVPIANTSTSSMSAQQVGSTVALTVRGTPFAGQGGIASPNSPEEDLAAALAVMASTNDVTQANTARQRAIDILEGNPIPGVAYSGIPLLNANPAAKTKVVPANGPVVVNIVRFGEHEISDTWLLDFSLRDPNLGFDIEYHVTELGGAEGGDLSPTPLLHQGGTPLGGLHSVVVPLKRDETALTTFQTSRFTQAIAGTPGTAVPRSEHTRIATQSVTVKMPPPKHVSVVLDPNLRPGHEALSVLRPSAGVAAPAVTIGELAASAPEKQIWSALQTPFADAGDANTVGAAQAGNVGTMRVKSHLPPGVSFNPASANMAVAFVNNEVYVSRTSLRLAPSPGATFTVQVFNRDGFAHNVSALALDTLNAVHGATDWGEFKWNAVGTPATIAAGASQVLTFTPNSTAFAFVIGDPDSGDQARAAITLDREADQQSFKVPGPAFAGPLHAARDNAGNIWVTVSGLDRIGKLTPAPSGKLADSDYVEYHLPAPPSFSPVWAPTDIAVDAQGKVWATLSLGNAVLRLDPATAESCDPVAAPGCTPSTTQGIRIVPLDPCGANECRVPFGPAETTVPVRLPTQMVMRQGTDGLPEAWFTEMMADKIGVVKILGNGQPAQNHFTCACQVGAIGAPEVTAGNPSGIDVDEAGSIWFAAANRNTIARLIPPVDLFATSIANTRHFNVPSGSEVNDPEIGGRFVTSTPHSVAVAPGGRVWFTELSQHKVGYVDTSTAVPDTTQGIKEIDISRNDFGAHNQPADLVADPAGTVFVADEYGDQITAVTRCGIKAHWRPTERLSFTDQPLVDPQGNLWFLELGANLITRIAGVAASPGAADSGAGCDGGSVGGPTTPTAPSTNTPAPIDPVKVACAKRQWAFGTAKSPRVLLLGNTAAQVTACIGRPTSKKGAVWRYGNRIQVTFRSGKVRSFQLLNASFRSAVGGVGVGSRVAVLRKLSSAKLTFNRAASTYRTVLPFAKGVVAEVVYAVGNGKVKRVTVSTIRVRA